MDKDNCLLCGEQIKRIRILYRDISARCLEHIFYNCPIRKDVLSKISKISIILLQNAMLYNLGKPKTVELEHTNINQDDIEHIFKTILFQFYLSKPPSEMYDDICNCLYKYGISPYLLTQSDTSI